jgi:hypothetical protein
MRDTLHAIHSGSNLDIVEEEEIRFIWNENSNHEIPDIEKLTEFEARRGRIPFYTSQVVEFITDQESYHDL